MAAQIIPFPKLTDGNEGIAPNGIDAMRQRNQRVIAPSPRLHIVRPSALARTQRTALRIVEDVCLEHHLAHPATESDHERSFQFWAALPVPPARVETPFSVAKRVMHFILPMVEHA